MADHEEPPCMPTEFSIAGETYCPMFPPNTTSAGDIQIPLHNLSAVRERMDTLQRFLLESISSNALISDNQMNMVSSEITSAIHQIFLNGAAILSSSQQPPLPTPVIQQPSDVAAAANDSDRLQSENRSSPVKHGADEYEEDLNCDIVEMDAVEILAEHVHFCEICGKGFRRDANLRMHMRAHGNQYKTLAALSKPHNSEVTDSLRRKTRFSCPFEGCSRNRKHKRFRPLKSVICVKNHFKRSHCPKMYSCQRCQKKRFSVVADLKSHLKHCGEETRWRCSCGNSFSRKDKLFGHMALFEGHMPAISGEDSMAIEEENKDEGDEKEEEEEEDFGPGAPDDEFFDGLLDGFNSIDSYCFQDVLWSPSGTTGANEFGDDVQ